MFRKPKPAGSDPPRYYVYLSTTKVAMLQAQIPARLAGALDAEVKASVGVLQATVHGGKATPPADDYVRAAVVDRYLTRQRRVGTVTEPAAYIKDVANLRYGVVWEYAADIAFFGGAVGGVKLGLIGSSDSMVGAVAKAEAGHAPFYYMLRFLGEIAETETVDPAARLPYHSYAEACDMALRATTGVQASMTFLARVLHREPDLIIATPIYVALTD